MNKDNELAVDPYDPYQDWPPKADWVPEQLQEDTDSSSSSEDEEEVWWPIPWV